MRMVSVMRVAARFVVYVGFMIVRVAVLMRVAVAFVAMLMLVRMLMPMMLAEHLLRQRIVFGESLVVAMLVTAAIRARLGLKRHRHLIDGCSDALQHIGENRIEFELQIIRADFNRRMTIAEVIRGARERQRIFRADHEHGFRCGDHAHEAAVVGDQHIAVAQNSAARQQHRHFLAVIERGREAALATFVERECQGRRALDQHGRELQMRCKQFVECAHD